MPTPNLEIVPVAAAQSQKHVTVNEAFARLDAAAQLTVEDRIRTAPPAAPAHGERYLIAANASAGWAGHEDDIASWDASVQGWIFLTPREGWHVWVIAEQQSVRFNGTSWGPATLGQFGVNATPDAINRFAVSSEAVLLNNSGTSIQAKLNKAGDGDTASILFQSNFKGHAEIGLTGDTDFHFKTSPDGVSFNEALTLDGATGTATFPAPALINGLSVGPELALNLLPDQGRFGGTSNTTAIGASNFILPDYLNAFNDSLIEPHAQFIHNNSTYGGPSGALDPEIDGLLGSIRAPSRRRYGSEWWAIKLTKGTGTNVAETVEGITRHPAIRTVASPLPRAYTVGYYLRVLSGSALVDQDLTSRFARWGADETGNISAGIVLPSDGWVFIERQMTFNAFGFNPAAIEVYLESVGDEALIALPRIVVGHVALDPFLPGPLPNDRCFG
jgi:hypothetical protein